MNIISQFMPDFRDIKGIGVAKDITFCVIFAVKGGQKGAKMSQS